MVDIGGDLTIWGIPANVQPLRLEIQDPWDEQAIVTSFEIRQGAVATSNKIHRHWFAQNGRRRHHLIDPNTGSPSESSIVQATVCADRASDADAYAKCLCLMDAEDALDWLTTHRRARAAWLIDRHGTVTHWHSQKENSA